MHVVIVDCNCSKDIRLPTQMQRAMAAEAEASREARAKVIAAEGEQKASRALREASEIIGDSPAALQLRYLQVRKSLAKNKLRKYIWYTKVREMRAELSSSEEEDDSPVWSQRKSHGSDFNGTLISRTLK